MLSVPEDGLEWDFARERRKRYRYQRLILYFLPYAKKWVFFSGYVLVEISCFVMFINISLKINSRFYKLTALGLSVEYMFQTFLTIGGVTKFIPSTGVTLPLVSYGGSSVTSTMILFAIIQGLYVKNSGRGEIGETDGKRQRRSRRNED